MLNITHYSVQFSAVQFSCSVVSNSVTPWITARQASLSITNSQSSPKLTCIESVMPSSHLIHSRPLLLLPSIPPSTRVFSNESTLLIIQFSHSVVSDFLQAHGLSTPGFPVHHQLLELAQTHVHQVGDAIQPSHPVIPFSSHLQSFPASGSFPMSQFFAWGGQLLVSVSASVLPMSIQCWFPLGLTGWISLQSKGLSRVFSNTTVQKHQFFSVQLSLSSNSHIHAWLLEKP